MSHGPFGLGGGTLAPTPVCEAIINVAPIVSAMASISTRLILVFMFILFALPASPSCRAAARAPHPGNARRWCILNPFLVEFGPAEAPSGGTVRVSLL